MTRDGFHHAGEFGGLPTDMWVSWAQASVSLGRPVEHRVMMTVPVPFSFFDAGTTMYQIRPPPVTLYCHWTLLCSPKFAEPKCLPLKRVTALRTFLRMSYEVIPCIGQCIVCSGLEVAPPLAGSSGAKLQRVFRDFLQVGEPPCLSSPLCVGPGPKLRQRQGSFYR